MNLQRMCLLLCSLLVTAASVVGCGQNAGPPQQVTQSDQGVKAAHDHNEHGEGSHQHGAWWCDEHGVPEAECALCDAKVAAAFKKKGDWCKEHDRPDSQCFICHPEKLEEYAARYEAKYGKKPPKPAFN